MRTTSLFLLGLFGLLTNVLAGNTLHQKMLWFSYNNTLAIGQHWLLHNEIESRQFVDPSAENLLALRTYVRYKVGKHLDFGTGFFYYLAGTQLPEKPTRLLTPELRPMQEVNNYFSKGRLTFHQRLRAEERFIHKTFGSELAEGYSFTLRFRYRIGIDVLLYQSKQAAHSLKLRISDEVMGQVGKTITHFYDQNRLSASILYQPPGPIGLEAGYLWWFQERATAGQYTSRQVFRLALLHKITLPAIRTKK